MVRGIRAPAALGLLLAAGCGTGLEGALSGISLLPDASSISSEVRAACEGVQTEQEILTSMVAARIDRLNGVTKLEEQATGAQNCAIDALLGGVDADACTACKLAILDQVFGN